MHPQKNPGHGVIHNKVFTVSDVLQTVRQSVGRLQWWSPSHQGIKTEYMSRIIVPSLLFADSILESFQFCLRAVHRGRQLRLHGLLHWTTSLLTMIVIFNIEKSLLQCVSDAVVFCMCWRKICGCVNYCTTGYQMDSTVSPVLLNVYVRRIQAPNIYFILPKWHSLRHLICWCILESAKGASPPPQYLQNWSYPIRKETSVRPVTYYPGVTTDPWRIFLPHVNRRKSPNWYWHWYCFSGATILILLW